MGQWGAHTHESDKAHDLMHDLKLVYKGDMKKLAQHLLIAPCEEMRSRFTMYDIAGVALMLLCGEYGEPVKCAIPRSTLAAVEGTLQQQRLPESNPVWKDAGARRKAITSELAMVRRAMKKVGRV
jgi:hypothetical protein